MAKLANLFMIITGTVIGFAVFAVVIYLTIKAEEGDKIFNEVKE